MEIYLMRHGPYLPKDQDPDEGLSGPGRQAVVASARALLRLGVRPGVMISSPKTRAMQTAALVAAELGFAEQDIQISPAAKAMAPPEDTLALLAGCQASCIMLVGHLPSLARVAGSLLSPDSEATIDFQPAGMCRIDAANLPTHQARLNWVLPPGIAGLLSP